jgi:hypothetical protein
MKSMPALIRISLSSGIYRKRMSRTSRANKNVPIPIVTVVTKILIKILYSDANTTNL